MFRRGGRGRIGGVSRRIDLRPGAGLLLAPMQVVAQGRGLADLTKTPARVRIIVWSRYWRDGGSGHAASLGKMVLSQGIEPWTSSLPMRCSTAEL